MARRTSPSSTTPRSAPSSAAWIATSTLVALAPQSIEGILNSISTVGAFAEAEDEAVGLVEVLRERLGAGERHPGATAPGRRLASRGGARRPGPAADGRPLGAGDGAPRRWLGAAGPGGGALGVPRPGSVCARSSREVHRAGARRRRRGRAPPHALESSPLPDWFDELEAVRDGELFAVDGPGLFSRPGPRIIEGIAVLAELFEPEAFADAGPVEAWMPLAPSASPGALRDQPARLTGRSSPMPFRRASTASGVAGPGRSAPTTTSRAGRRCVPSAWARPTTTASCGAGAARRALALTELPAARPRRLAALPARHRRAASRRLGRLVPASWPLLAGSRCTTGRGRWSSTRSRAGSTAWPCPASSSSWVRARAGGRRCSPRRASCGSTTPTARRSTRHAASHGPRPAGAPAPARPAGRGRQGRRRRLRGLPAWRAPRPMPAWRARLGAVRPG